MMEEVTLPPLLSLPAELVHHILTYIPPASIAAVSAASQLLRQHALSEQLWQPLVNENLPEPLSTPAPLPSFRALYAAHHPYWFLTKHRLWYADSQPNGKLLVARYDARRGCIEAYSVVAERGSHTFQLWQHDASVAIHSFNPRVQLDLNQPVLKLDIGSPRAKVHVPARRQPRTMANWFRPDSAYEEEDSDSQMDAAHLPPPLSQEVLMDCSAPAGLYTSFILARDHPQNITGPGTAVWPPLRIPANTRTRNTSLDSFSASAHRPTRLDQVSQNTFRLRKWIEFASRHTHTGSILNPGSAQERFYDAINMGFSAQNLLRGIGGQSVRMGEDVATYATLPPSCYTPTPEKPWRGIWCGDYSGHGCEFLVVLQPEKGEERPLPQGMEWMHEWLTTGTRRRESGSSWSSHVSAFEQVQNGINAHDSDEDEILDSIKDDETVTVIPSTIDQDTNFGLGSSLSGAEGVYSGRIEAVKLTGDPNIPRGEYTFIAPDISDAGLDRIADEEPFKGARICRSAGHIADRGFTNDEYMPSQLILISHDRLAQIWSGFGHISYYQRVNLGELLKF